jgi:hypothetical protein
MNTTKQIESVVERWQKLPHDFKPCAAAGFLGRIIGISYSADAVSMAKLLEALETEVANEEQAHAARLQAQQVATMTEADE